MLDIRKDIKQLKLENFRLRQHLEVEEEIEDTHSMPKEIEEMTTTELRNKMLKLA